ncbi:MAG: hypothetical protein JWO77_3000 [Ilumatobacteraceae bacterium]|nr:hypothetical protein [Ilumatobacteraceae bacterium]
MTDEPIDPTRSSDPTGSSDLSGSSGSTDGLDERLRRGFDHLARAAGHPPPLPDAPGHGLPALHRSTPRVLVAAAIVAILVLTAGAVLVATGGDDPGEDLHAGTGTTTSTEPDHGPKETPVPTSSHLLLCPPALLDVSRLPVQPTLVPDPGVDATADSSGPYELTWEQDGQTVRLQYPGMFHDVPMTDRGRSRSDELDRGGMLVTFTRGPTLARVDDRDHERDPDTNVPCHEYDLLVEGPDEDGAAIERTTARTIAEAVRIVDPPGGVTVPAVTGMSRAEAQDALARAGLIPDWTWSYVASDATPVTVQEPAAGTTTAAGTVVTLATDQPGFPVPGTPIACPMGRLVVDAEMGTPSTEEPGAIVSWTEKPFPAGIHAQVSWPNVTGGSRITAEAEPSFEQRNAHRITINGRPALMHDEDLNGPHLVYDTGLPGLCRFLEVGVYGDGATFAERTDRAIELATEKITILPPPTGEPPDVTGLPLRAAVDRLARAGFAPVWGEARAINDEVPTLLRVPTTTVIAQTVTEPGVVRLET